MSLFKLCGPSLIFMAFSLTQIIIDSFKGFYNTAFMKFLVTIVFTLLLNALCDMGLSIVAWIIVFVPFVLMTIISSMLLYIFGLEAKTGKLDYSCKSDIKVNDKVIITTQSQPESQYYPFPYVHYPPPPPPPPMNKPPPPPNQPLPPPLTNNAWTSSNPAYQTHDMFPFPF